MANINKITLPNGTSYDIETDWSRVTNKPTYNESNISAIQYQNGTNYLRMPPKVSTVRANRLAFLPADQIIVEQTTDGGATWVSAGLSDDAKRHLFAETRGYSLPLPKINNTRSKLCGLRITITAMKYDVPAGTAETQKYSYWNSTKVKSTERYCTIDDMYFWVNAVNDRIGVKVESATGANSNTWTVLFDAPTWGMTGWSGSDCIKLPSYVFGGSTGQTTQAWNYRMTFMTVPPNGQTELAGGTYATSYQSIMEIRGYGTNIWTVPNEYASNDKLYTIDINKNATFPANITTTNNIVGSNIKSKGSSSQPVYFNANGIATATDGSNIINGLGIENSDPTDADYYVSQFVGGGTTTTSYHRRPHSALWNYIKGKISSVLGLTATSYSGKAITAGTADTANSVAWSNVSGRPTKVSDFTNDSGFTSNAGTVTSVAVKMNNTVKGTVTSNGTIDLGTVITSHQSLSGYATQTWVNQQGFAKESDIPTIAEIEAIVDRKLGVIENGSY